VSRVHLLSAAASGEAKAHLDLEQMRDSARADRFGVHQLVEDPAAADLILFVETSWAAGYYFESVRRHPVYREFGPRCFLFSATDRVVPFLPGVYASIERRWAWPAWTRAGYYPGVREGGGLEFEDPPGEPTHLFSLVGAGAGHPVRRLIVDLPDRDALLIDTDAERGGLGPAEYRRRYAESVRDSAFVLCPRGGGTSSFRLFEAMMLGRPPVIISDQWVAPRGPGWESFSLRVGENDVDSIPDLLAARRGQAAEMGVEARRAWVDWFSEQAGFHRTVEWCLELQRALPARGGARRYAPYLQMVRPYHAARKLAKGLGHGDDRQA
jgi:hypothetical protein